MISCNTRLYISAYVWTVSISNGVNVYFGTNDAIRQNHKLLHMHFHVIIPSVSILNINFDLLEWQPSGHWKLKMACFPITIQKDVKKCIWVNYEWIIIWCTITHLCTTFWILKRKKCIAIYSLISDNLYEQRLSTIKFFPSNKCFSQGHPYVQVAFPPIRVGN